MHVHKYFIILCLVYLYFRVVCLKHRNFFSLFKMVKAFIINNCTFLLTDNFSIDENRLMFSNCKLIFSYK